MVVVVVVSFLSLPGRRAARPGPAGVERMADLDARSIWAETTNGTVHLRGPCTRSTSGKWPRSPPRPLPASSKSRITSWSSRESRPDRSRRSAPECRQEGAGADLQVDAGHIGVSAEAGDVTLTGHVASYAERIAAVRAAERVYGVRVVADEIIVRPAFAAPVDDADISEEIVRQFRWNILIPEEVTVEVRDGTSPCGVRSGGRSSARPPNVRQGRKGCRDVDNLTTIKPRDKPKQRRSNGESPTGSSDGGPSRHAASGRDHGWSVHLHGTVHSLHEKTTCEEAALSLQRA